jgi:hypothetical protein
MEAKALPYSATGNSHGLRKTITEAIG